MSTLDGQKSRSEATQKALMLAAEKLVAQKGIKNVSVKEIVKTAGQKNESALQYHFKNLQGLINSLEKYRSKQTQEKRESLLEELLADGTDPTLRDLCGIMVFPTFQLCKASVEYKRFVIGFSHEIALTESSALDKTNKHGGGGASGLKTGKLLRSVLPHLDEANFRHRMDGALRLCSVSMGHHARQKNAFKGASAEYFVSSLVDALEGLLSAPVSEETLNIAKQISSG